MNLLINQSCLLQLQNHIHRLMHQLHSLSLVSGVASGVTSPIHLPPNSMAAATHPPSMMPFVPVPSQVSVHRNNNNGNNNHRSPRRPNSHHRQQQHNQRQPVYHQASAVPGVLGSPFGYPTGNPTSAPASSQMYNFHYQMPMPLSSASMLMAGQGQIHRPGSTSTSHSSASNSPPHYDVDVLQDNTYYEYQQDGGRTASNEEEDDSGINEQLAEAILKRPDSLRSPGSSSSVGSYTSSGSKNTGMNGGGFSALMANGSARANANAYNESNENSSGVEYTLEKVENGLPSSSSVSLGSESDRTPVSGVQNGNADIVFSNLDELEKIQHQEVDGDEEVKGMLDEKGEELPEDVQENNVDMNGQKGAMNILYNNSQSSHKDVQNTMDHLKDTMEGNYNQVSGQMDD